MSLDPLPKTRWAAPSTIPPSVLQTVAALAIVGALAAVILVFVVAGFERGVGVAAGMAALIILLVPLLFRRSYDALEPMSFVILTVIIGVALRSVYLAFDRGSFQQHLLLDRPLSTMDDAYILIFAGLFLLNVGYYGIDRGINLDRIPGFSRANWDARRLLAVTGVLILIALLSGVLYIRAMGIQRIALETFSRSTRGVAVEGGGYGYAALGYHKWGMSLAQPAFYLLLAWVASGRKHRLRSGWGILVGVAGLVAFMQPVLSNARGASVSIILNAFAILYYLTGRITKRIVTIAILGSLGMLMTLTAVRSIAWSGESLSSFYRVDRVARTIVVNRNFFGVPKLALITDAVPERLDYQMGRTFGLWLVAPVPRRLWPEKPVIGVGQTIGTDVYGHAEGGEGAGVPPGFMAEAYWNFGPVASLIGMFVAGLMFRMFYLSLSPYLDQRNQNAILVYVTLFLFMPANLLGGDVSRTIIGILRNGIPLAFALFIVQASSRPRMALDSPTPGPVRGVAES